MPNDEPISSVREGGGWAALPRLGLLRVGGPQRVKFLHNLLSNDVSGLQAGQSRLAALMNLKGQQVAWMRVLAEADALICELPLATRQTVVDTFVHYKVGAPVRFEAMDVSVFGLFGPKAENALRALGFETPPQAIDTFQTLAAFGGTLRASRGGDLPAGGFTLHADPIAQPTVEARLHASLGAPISEATLDTLRIEEGIPWHGIDVSEENLLHETGQLAVYHAPSKGCYLGQEVVARLEGRGGNVNKRFRGFKSFGVLRSGDDVVADGKVVGRVTSAGQSPRFGNIAMGYVHRSHADEGVNVTIRDLEVGVVALPFKT